jgi:hypothetical protein
LNASFGARALESRELTKRCLLSNVSIMCTGTRSCYGRRMENGNNGSNSYIKVLTRVRSRHKEPTYILMAVLRWVSCRRHGGLRGTCFEVSEDHKQLTNWVVRPKPLNPSTPPNSLSPLTLNP